MRRAIRALLAALLLVGGAAVAWRWPDSPSPVASRPVDAKPKLALLTSLPLVFGEQFALAGGGSPALARIEQNYEVRAIGVADAASLRAETLLLMAHPRAQPAEALVELDAWVRAGGRLLLLADPKLDWHSERPLGDRLRPPPNFADTGLLGHWGVALDGPSPDGPAQIDVGDYAVLAASPGRLTGRCAISAAGLIARCRVGAGKVTVIADADFLHVEGEGALDGPVDRNLDLLTDELARLAAK